MNVLIACEESQAVVTEMRRLGHYAFSCDTQECSGGHPEWHIKGDALDLLNRKELLFLTQDGTTHSVGGWDLIIAHPPCTYLTNAGAVRMCVAGEIQPERYKKCMEARDFFMKFYEADCPRIAIENPTPMKIAKLPPYDQAIQPYHFGHPYSKRTCLWLKGLPPLFATCLVEDHTPYVNGGCKDAHGKYRRFQGRRERDPKSRSKTFPGTAKAMAEQWAGKCEVTD